MVNGVVIKADDREGNQNALDDALKLFNAEAAKGADGDLEILIEAGANVKLYRGRMARLDTGAAADAIRPDVAKATAVIRKASSNGDVQRAVGLMSGGGTNLPRFVVQFLEDGSVSVKAFRGTRGKGGTFTDADIRDSEPKAENDKATS